MLQQGTQLGPYTLVRALGRGGFAFVWEAIHRGDARKVALKILHSSHLLGVAHQGPTIAERFISEAQMLRAIDHPGVVKVLDLMDLRPNGPVVYAMELLEGQDLDSLRPELDTVTLLALIQQVCDTLAYLHERGIVHRDIKAPNLFVCRTDVPLRFSKIKLIDFGIAKDLVDTSQRTGMGLLLGTMRAMPPEAFARLSDPSIEVTAAADQWGLGITLYRLLTGDAPFRVDGFPGIMDQVMSAPLPPMVFCPPFQGDVYASALISVVERCLRKRPEDRYPSMHALSAALRQVSARVALESTQRVNSLHMQEISSFERRETTVDVRMPSEPIILSDSDFLLVSPGPEKETSEIPPFVDERTEIPGASESEAVGNHPRPKFPVATTTVSREIQPSDWVETPVDVVAPPKPRKPSLVAPVVVRGPIVPPSEAQTLRDVPLETLAPPAVVVVDVPIKPAQGREPRTVMPQTTSETVRPSMVRKASRIDPASAPLVDMTPRPVPADAARTKPMPWPKPQLQTQPKPPPMLWIGLGMGVIVGAAFVVGWMIGSP